MDGPESMRQRLADYVDALHRAYLTQAEQLAPAERAGLPLWSRSAVTVIVAAAHDLHLVATTDPLPAPRGQEVELPGEFAGVTWTVRFYDASVLPELGLIPARPDEQAAVRRVLGVADVVYHLAVSPGGGLGAHHAQHAGVALANLHAEAFREGQALRRLYPGREALVDELGVAERTGLTHAARLLAREIAGPGLSDADLTGDPAALRRALLQAGRSRRP